MRRTSIVATVVAVSLAAPFFLSAAPTVLAQTGAAAPSASASSDADLAKKKDEAKEHFLKGVSLMQEEQWDAALVEFQTSITLFPTRNARKNAAVCLRQLGRFAEALDQYETLMRDFGSQLPPADLEQVTKAINDLKGLTGYIVVNAPVAGATVVIDSKPRGKTPLPPIRVAQGTHTIGVFAEGYVPFEATQNVLGKQTVTIDAKMPVLSKSGRLQIIEETGAEADIVIDGAPKGKTGAQPYEERIAPGMHWVALKGAGKLGTQPVPAKVEADQTLVIRLKLEELPAEVRVETDPIGSQILLDGVIVGQGSWEGRLRAGSHKIDASSEGYFRTTKSFEARAEDGKQTWKVVLERDENSPFWSKGRTRPISVGLYGDMLIGLFGFGSDYERNCSGVTQQSPTSADCYQRKNPFGGGGGVRGAYEVAPGFAIELQLGYMYVSSSLARRTKLLGEGRTIVDVDILDEWSLSGVQVGAGFSYVFLRRPIVISGAIAGGAIFNGKVREKRSGNAACYNQLDKDGKTYVGGQQFSGANNCSTAMVLNDRANPGAGYSARPMAAWPATPISATIPWVAPEMRFALPITDALQVGIGVSVLIGLANAKPFVQQTPQSTPADRTPSGQTAEGNVASIGFVPQKDAPAGDEKAVGTFLFPRASLFVKLAF